MQSQPNKPHAPSCLASAEAMWTDGLFFGDYMAGTMEHWAGRISAGTPPSDQANAV